MPAVQKTTKKRLAPSQDGPTAKKGRVSKQATSKLDDESVKKRKQPVTLPVTEIDEEDFDEESGDVESGEENAASPMDVDNEPSKDTNGSFLGTFPVLITLMRSIN